MQEFPPAPGAARGQSPPGLPATFRAALEAKGLTCYAVAKLAGIPNSSTVRDIEAGRNAHLSDVQAVPGFSGCGSSWWKKRRDRTCERAERPATTLNVPECGREKEVVKKMLGPTLQEFELVPVNDPGELATLDRRFRAAENAKPSTDRAGRGKSTKRK